MSGANDLGDELAEGLMGDFLDESGGLVSQLSDNLIVLHQWAKGNSDHGAPPPVALLNEMFRAAHSVKGLSGMLRLKDINVLTHKIENIFDAARNGEMPIGTRTVDTMLQAVDCLAAMLDALKLADAGSVDSSEVLEQLERVLSTHGVGKPLANQKQAEEQLAQLTAEVSSAAAAVPTQHDLPATLENVVDDPEVPPKYLGIFIDESSLTLEELSDLLLAPFTAATMEALLVSCHRIKGSAASIGLQRAARLAHVMEDILQDLCRRSEVATPLQADTLFQCVDALRAYVANLKSGVGGADSLSEAYCAISKVAAADLNTTTTLAKTSGAQFNPAAATWAEQVQSQAPRDIEGVIGRVRFESNLPLAEFKARLLVEKLKQFGKLFFCYPAEDVLEAEFHEHTLVFGVETGCAAEQIEAAMKLEGVVEVSARRIEQPVASSTTVRVSEAESSTTVSVEGESPREAKSTAQADNKSKPTETLRVDIERLDQLMSLAGQLVINRARFGQIGERLKGLSSVRMLSHSLAGAQRSAARLASSLQSGETNLRTPADDVLVSMASKLQDDLEAIHRDVSSLSQLRGVLTDLAEAVHQLDRVSDGIQSTVMDTRMVPIGPLFTRFKRAIRDLTRENKKDIQLEIGGETTELDKRMIDELGDPLIHLVRNSVDHGIETPDVREAAGKPRQGTITLNAYHRGNRIVIEVADDGRGLDADRIRAKAISKGMITEADAEKMSTRQIHDLIWRPGFSTAEKITEVSGRGMGMDIVWSKIESLSGTVELTSEPGKGTTFAIHLPLTLAIMPSLLAVIDGDVFAVPVETVIEIVRVKATELTTVHGRSAIRVRGRVISLVALRDVFRWNAISQHAEAIKGDTVTLVIVGNPAREVGILVDSLVGEQDVVIQSLAENFQNIEGVAGASILGDGRVSLILDVGTLLEMACRPAGRLPGITAELVGV